MAQLVGVLSYMHWDLGSIPRSPIFSIIFVITCSYAVCSWRPTMHTHAQACHLCMRIHLKAMNGGPPCTLVNHSIRNSRKSKRPCILGPNFSNKTSLWVWIPPWFAHFFIFIWFSFLILLVVFNYFL